MRLILSLTAWLQFHIYAGLLTGVLFLVHVSYKIPTGWFEGTLANPASAVPVSFGTPVKFEVRKGDPIPYIKWVAPGTSLAALLERRASVGFWHDVAERRFDR